MLNIVCVNAGNYLGRGADYVNILADMVARNISKETAYKFICFTDTQNEYDPEIDVRPLPAEGLTGWWNKLALFKDGLFPDADRIIYLDLDTVIVNGLDEIIKYDGEFAILEDFYRSEGMQSSVMMWRSNSIGYMWEKWVAAGMPQVPGGDQAWIERTCYRRDILQELYPDFFVSFKVHAQFDIPKNTRMVIFHGQPRPHEVTSGWMPHVWKIGGGTILELKHVGNVSEEKIAENIRAALRLSLPWLQLADEHTGHAVIVGGGPSLKKDLNEIRERQKHGQMIFSVNNAFSFMASHDLYADCQVMIDAREENKDFVPAWGFKKRCYYASQVHPACIEKASKNGSLVTLFHSFFSDGIFNIIGHETGDPLVGGGCTVGLHAIALAWVLGYRNFHLYGFDSSYEEGKNHAYPQALNDSDRIIEVMMNEKKYLVAPWMATQVEHFKELAKELVERGCIITVHGSGLLPDAAKIMSMPNERDTEIVCLDGTWWPSKCRESRLNAEFTFNDIDTVISACNGKNIAVQAGGNVGVWPREFSKHFKKVYTFEPDDLNFECLLRNCPADNIIATHAALGDKDGSGALERVSYNCGAHYLKNGDEFPITTIDALNLDSCDLIQLDIEGFELNALKGAQKTIDAFHPVIMVEDKGLSQRYGSAKGDIAKWLEPMGYIAYANTNRDVIFKHQ